MNKNRKNLKKNEIKTLSEETKRVMNKVPANVKYIFLWIIGLAILFIVLNYLFPYIYGVLGVGKINYQGLVFTKEVIGEKPHAIPVYHYYYLYQNKKGEVIQNNIYLRNNPSLVNIPVNTAIDFVSEMPVYLGIDTDNLVKCNQSSLAVSALTSFIKNADHSIYGGALNKTESEANNITNVECGMKKDAMVIKLMWGENTEITSNNACYEISVSSCSDVLPAAEKFIVQTIIDAKNRK